MNSPAEVAGAMAAAGCSPEQIAATLTKLEGIKSAQLRRERNQRYYQSRVLKRLTPPSEPVLQASETCLNSSESETPLARVHNLALSLESKEVREDKSSLRSDSSAEGADLFSAEKIDRAKAKADARRIELKSFGEAWNDIAADHRLPEIDSIDPGSTRERQALATLKWLRDHDSDPQAFFAKIRAGPYLLGEVNGFRASFDWVCKAANRQKIMDGNYENREKAKSFVDQFRAPHIAR